VKEFDFVMHLKTVFGNGAMAVATLILAYPAVAQPVPAKASNACIQRTAEEMVVATRDITVTGAGPVDPENGVRTLFMRNKVNGQTANCRVNTIDGTVLSVNVSGTGTTPPTTPAPPVFPAPPTAGSFAGRGKATGAVFGTGRQADAALSFNQTRRFSLSVAVPPGNGVQIQYQGVINQISNTVPNNPNSFFIQGRLESFASSANKLQVFKSTGSCWIEVFDARIVSVYCNTGFPASSAQFRGMVQF
jgi:hypothetical protein